MNEHARGDTRTIQTDFRRLRADVRGATSQADRFVRDTVSASPLVAVGTAAALGFLIGGGVPRSALATFLGVGARMAGSWLQREFLERNDPQE
jgi:hypothetical protein